MPKNLSKGELNKRFAENAKSLMDLKPKTIISIINKLDNLLTKYPNIERTTEENMVTLCTLLATHPDNSVTEALKHSKMIERFDGLREDLFDRQAKTPPTSTANQQSPQEKNTSRRQALRTLGITIDLRHS